MNPQMRTTSSISRCSDAEEEEKMGFYLNLTGKMFLGSLAALGAAKLVEALTEDDHRSVEEKMTPEWKSAVERAHWR